MVETSGLLNLKEVSRILKINTEVLRRWLRNGKLPGIKVGSDWRVNPADLQPFLEPVSQKGKGIKNAENSQKMCFRFPKWLEFSGLPRMLNQKYGPECWPILKKMIELDFELGKPADRMIPLDRAEIAERVGYDEKVVVATVQVLIKAGFISLHKTENVTCFSIVTPIRTPKLILDIPYEKGGVKGAPGPALNNVCLRRFLESGESS